MRYDTYLPGKIQISNRDAHDFFSVFTLNTCRFTPVVWRHTKLRLLKHRHESEPCGDCEDNAEYDDADSKNRNQFGYFDKQVINDVEKKEREIYDNPC